MILTETKEIGDKIRAVLKRGNGRRIAIVAFVGRDALKFVGDPAGLEVYCWPNGAATNPDGIRDLQDAGATVYFVDRLHMKLFWSERGGYVLGSPNLSSNALDETLATNLLESAVYESDSSSVPLEAILQQLKRRGVEPATTDLIEKLEDEYYNRSTFRSSSKADTVRARTTFDKYLASTSPPPWSFVAWQSSGDVSKRDLDAASAFLEQHTGRTPRSRSTPIDDSIVTKLKKPAKWILAVKVIGDGTKLGKLEWIYNHTTASHYTTATTIIQVKGAETPSTPFDLASDDFQSRFSVYLSSVQDGKLANTDGTFNIARFLKFEQQQR